MSRTFNLKFLHVFLKKKTPRKALFYFFFTKKNSTVIYTEGVLALS